MFQPKPLKFRVMSSGDSSNVTKTPFSPACRIPDARNWTAKTVLALPEVPESSVTRPCGSPPLAIRSNPAISVRILGTERGGSIVLNFEFPQSIREAGTGPFLACRSSPKRTRSASDRSPMIRRIGGGNSLTTVGVAKIFSSSAS